MSQIRPNAAPYQESLHYRLTATEWLTAIDRLRKSELKILFYLRTLNPFGDRSLAMTFSAIAQTLNMAKGTVSKAMRALVELGYVQLESQSHFRVKVLKGAVSAPPEPEAASQPVENFEAPPLAEAVLVEPRFPDGNARFLAETSVSPEKPQFPPGNLRSPQVNPGKGFGADQIDQSFKTFKSDPPNPEPGKPPEPPQDQLLRFVTAAIKRNPQIKNIRAYARVCLQRSKDHWIQQFWAAHSKSPIEPPTQPVPPAAAQAGPTYPAVGSTALPADLADVVAEIQVQLSLLGWTKDQAIDYMVERFGWKRMAFSRLTALDLGDLWGALQAIP